MFEVRRRRLTIHAHVDYGPHPGLPIFQGLPEKRHFKLFMLRRGLVIFLETADDAGAISIGKELCIVGEIVNHPERGNPDKNSCNALENLKEEQ